MRKYFIYLMMALAIVAFNACSDDDPVEPETPDVEVPEEPEKPENPEPLKIQMTQERLIIPTLRKKQAIFSLHTLVGEVPLPVWQNRLPDKLVEHSSASSRSILTPQSTRHVQK